MSRAPQPHRLPRHMDIHCLMCDAAVTLDLVAYKPRNRDKPAESVWRGVCEECKAETDARTLGGGK